MFSAGCFIITLTGDCCSGVFCNDRLLHGDPKGSAILGGELSSLADEFPIRELVFLPRVDEDGDAGTGHLKWPLLIVSGIVWKRTFYLAR